MSSPFEMENNGVEIHLGLLRNWATALSAAFAGLNVASSAEMSRQRGEPETVVQEQLDRARKLADISEKLQPHSVGKDQRV